MTNQQILEKAIEKAVANGWKPLAMDYASVDKSGHIVFFKHGNKFYQFSPYQVVYDHEFAKALWGDRPEEYLTFAALSASNHSEENIDTRGLLPFWQYRLMEMVIAADPIAYLGQHLDD